MSSDFEKSFEKAMTAAGQIEAAEKGLINVEARGTCQACLEQYVAKPYSKMKRQSRFTGEPMNYKEGSLVMVKHGYQRPGHGYLIGECWGVGHPPFQLDCTITKHWRQYLITTALPDRKKHLSDLRSGKIKEFSFNVRMPRKKDQPYWAQREERTFFLTEGQPLPSDWPLEEQGQPNFKRRRESAIKETEEHIEQITQTITHLGKAIAAWKYAPEALKPKKKPLNEAQTARRWIETTDWKEFEKLPNPKAGNAYFPGKTFADYARRALRPSGMSRRVSPSSYTYVRQEYEKLTGAKPLFVAAPEREPEVISREKQEQLAARKAKLDAREKAKQEKIARAAKVGDKAVADIEILRKAIADMVNNQKFMDALRNMSFVNPYTGQVDERSRYIITMDWIKRSKLLPLIVGEQNVDNVIDTSKAEYKYSSVDASSIRRDLREIYESMRKDGKELGFKFKAL